MLSVVRTTVTLDEDTVAIVERLGSERGNSFMQALNDAIRAGADAQSVAAPFTTRIADLGVCLVNLDRALAMDAAIDDDEILRRQRRET